MFIVTSCIYYLSLALCQVASHCCAFSVLPSVVVILHDSWFSAFLFGLIPSRHSFIKSSLYINLDLLRTSVGSANTTTFHTEDLDS